jgi:signal transduction histidine kinase
MAIAGLWYLKREVEKKTRNLQGEIIERKQVEEALKQARSGLEQTVIKRTRELSTSNTILRKEIEDRKMVEEALRLDESRLEALVKLSQHMGEPIKETSDLVLEEGVKLTKSEMGFIGFINEAETDLTIHAWSKTAMERCSVIEKPFHFPLEKAGIWGEAVQKREPGIINDYNALGNKKKGYPKGHVEISRFMAVPIFHGDRIVIVSAVANKEEDYNKSDIRQLTLLFDGLWRIIYHKNTQEALKRSEAELRHLSSKLLEAQEKESKRIGQELHDGLAQNLSAVKVWGEAALLYLDKKDMDNLTKSLGSIVSLAQGDVEEVRRIIFNLRPTILDDFGIIAAISWLCQDFQAMHSGILIEKEIEIQETVVSDSLKIVIFRVIQEAFNNIRKHSKADLVCLSLKETDDTIELTIYDNGVGFESEKIPFSDKLTRGLGLSSMKERVGLSAGTFAIESSEGAGTTIRVLWEC